jgi:hypothetical protein
MDVHAYINRHVEHADLINLLLWEGKHEVPSQYRT